MIATLFGLTPEQCEGLRGYIVAADSLERVADLVDTEAGATALTAQVALEMLAGVDALALGPGPRGAGAAFAVRYSGSMSFEELRARAASLVAAESWGANAGKTEA